MKTSNIGSKVSEMTEGYKNNSTQIAVFEIEQEGKHTKYGINVNKIKSFINLKDFNITKTSINKSIKGYCVVRNESFPMVDLYEWLSGTEQKLENYEKLILTEFSGTSLAFPVTRILRIFTKTSEELEEPGGFFDKVSYITKIELVNTEVEQLKNKKERLEKQISVNEKRNKKLKSKMVEKKIKKNQDIILEIDRKIKTQDTKNEEELCFILDIEKLVNELSNKEDNFEDIIKNYENKFNITEPILIAEDSVVVQKNFRRLFDNLKIPYEIFKNGKEVIKRMNGKTNFSLIITDIEMPILDGFSVIKWIKENFPKTKIIVNTSMSNNGVKEKCKSLGVDIFIEKNRPDRILIEIENLLKKEEIK